MTSPTPSTNYTAGGTNFSIPTADDIQFDRDHLALSSTALEQHTHADTRGLAVARLALAAIDAADKFAAGVVDNAALGTDAVGPDEIQDSAVQTYHIGANAITDYVINFPGGTDSTTSATFVNVSGLDTDITLPADSHILVFYGLPLQNASVHQDITVGLLLDGLSTVFKLPFNNPDGNAHHIFGGGLFPSVAAGDHTVHVRWQTSGGTLLTTADRFCVLLRFSK